MQTLFFLLQGQGGGNNPDTGYGLESVCWNRATGIFNLATSLLFFASVNGMFPFYSRGLPKWLTEW